MVETIEGWVAKNCKALQPVLDSAEIAINKGVTNEVWSCPNCSVKVAARDRKSTRLNSSHLKLSRMPSSA